MPARAGQRGTALRRLGLLLLTLTGALALRHEPRVRAEQPKWMPVVLWHGMGDSCCSAYSMGAIKGVIEQALPSVFVHSISTGGASEAGDVFSSYFGSVNAQVAAVCDELLGMEELRDGYVAIGFSQGGQFLRAVVQRCQHLGPRMHTLVTLGAQHQGVAAVPGCPEPAAPSPAAAPGRDGGSSKGSTGGSGEGSSSGSGGSGENSSSGSGNGATSGSAAAAGDGASFYCRMMQGLIAKGAYLSWMQDHLVQAQYVKDPLHIDLYRQRSAFLADINGDVPGRPPPARYHANLASLSSLVLFQFDDDDMVVPKESAHFGFFNGSDLIEMRDTPLYQQDWIGLRTLDEAGKLTLAHAPGRHMHFTLEWFRDAVVPYLSVPAAGPSGAGGGRVQAQR